MMKKFFLIVVLVAPSIFGFTQQRVAPYRSAAEKLNEEYCTGLFKTADGTYFDMLNDRSAAGAISYSNILDWLEGRVAGLQVYKTRTNVSIPFLRNSLAGVYVDEMYVDPGYLSILAVTDIAMVKIIKGPFAGGFNSPGGIIAIYTIRGEEEE